MMELIFIRHGQGEHTLDLPESLKISDPSLTKLGIDQAISLREKIALTENDIILISPIRRTLETALLWSGNIKCRKVVHPLVSPRMFPIHPEWSTLPCDKILDIELIESDFPTFEIENSFSKSIWLEGINVLPENLFLLLVEEFVTYCKQFQKEKIYIVSHDGTITSYRQSISGKKLTRKDFPEEIAWFTLTC
ncbi:histidine phosphatase family protein [Bacillus sp. FSL K6-3431]|uniref:histidine phosphatase family protein n=1 Tax=Bacillus sp. FSL K6-3431 TaxID=2921500 RepID=UPI0030FCC5C5